MTKGIFTLAGIGGTIAGELVIKRNWKKAGKASRKNIFY